MSPYAVVSKRDEVVAEAGPMMMLMAIMGNVIMIVVEMMMIMGIVGVMGDGAMTMRWQN